MLVLSPELNPRPPALQSSGSADWANPTAVRKWWLQFSSSTMKQTKIIPHQFPRCFPLLLREKLFEKNYPSWMSAKRRCKLQVIKGGNFGAKLTHLCRLWLDVSFFSHVKKHLHDSYWTIIFFMCWNHCSLLWLARKHLLLKNYNIFLSISQYVYTYTLVPHSHFRAQ